MIDVDEAEKAALRQAEMLRDDSGSHDAYTIHERLQDSIRALRSAAFEAGVVEGMARAVTPGFGGSLAAKESK